ncbi:MAG: hypothetical protein AAGC49_09810 [Brevundimonas sp.]
MRRVAGSRRQHIGVLTRSPRLDPMYEAAASRIRVSRVDQVRQLLSLVDGGLLSADEFEREATKLFRGGFGGSPAR